MIARFLLGVGALFALLALAALLDGEIASPSDAPGARAQAVPLLALAALTSGAGAAMPLLDRKRRPAPLASVATLPPSEPAVALAEHGRVAASAGRFAEALAWFDATLESDPRAGPVHLARGLALEALERYGEAHEAYARAVALSPRDALAFYCHGRSFLWWGFEAEALARLQVALALDPALVERARGDALLEPLKDHKLFRALLDRS